MAKPMFIESELELMDKQWDSMKNAIMKSFNDKWPPEFKKEWILAVLHNNVKPKLVDMGISTQQTLKIIKDEIRKKRIEKEEMNKVRFGNGI